MERADAVIIGGGVMGTSIGLNLMRRRFGRVVLLEKNTICSGTSGKSSAVVRTHYTTRPTAMMALLARRIFENFREAIGGESGFVRTGMLVIGTPESREAVEATVRMNQELGIETGLVTAAEARAIDPLLTPADDAPIAYEPASGYASPHEVASSYARRFTDLGGVIRQGTLVTGIGTGGGRVRSVQTDRGEIATAHAVIAAGPWADRVGRLAGIELPVMASRQPIVILRPKFEYGSTHPVVIDLADEIYSRPETGNLILLGNTRHGDDRPGDPDDYEDRPDLATATDLVERFARLMPGAAEAEISGGWSGMYEISPDWNPIMGSAPGVAGLHFCVGFSGHGFKLSPVAGILMAEHIADGHSTTLDITPYRLERFAEGQELRIAYRRAGVVG
ncbi:MAG TPA: FAD-binding oxidoreductase [Methylomirabilota bacterium]|jgi:glycine/D-amino acid oxidase-like deaminating enzyme|nr:FAD-binding oxidoreductase [Methylomirabilota bacterium]HEV8673495.1 FAD-binding oxidoreductase [Methylomirabilota bacterium]